MKTCMCCNKTLPIENFYTLKSHGDKDNKYAYCKECSTKKVKEFQQKFKQLCVDYKGGKCETCGYNKCIASLDFHHLDPSKKDFAISKVRRTTLTNEVKVELDKCILLCRNCHAELHYYEVG
jgi:hypothetical protein